MHSLAMYRGEEGGKPKVNVDIKCITLHLKPLRRAFLGFPRESHREQEADKEGGEEEEVEEE